MGQIIGGYSNLLGMLYRQLENLYGLDEEEREVIDNKLTESTDLIFNHFSRVKNKYFSSDCGAILDPLNSTQYCILLYKLSKMVHQKQLADKLYLLNKVLNSCDIYHGIDLPQFFLPEHPVGTVLGRAKYSDYFVFQQNCTVGGNRGIYPTIGSHVWMFANTSIIGNCQIGSNVYVAAGTQIKDENIPDNSLVFGSSPNLIIKQRTTDYFEKRSPFRL
ncbi:hypothetical protein [Psychrobacter sp. MES7-P7E]|uniref:hypothetical protein n=1 Tax=Psychrobacter sp. MES7-P7E TaxID=2058322 RepID=UPI0018D59524|nr:hypothetical protein [Psychrobacter sp. MES7-P7E]